AVARQLEPPGLPAARAQQNQQASPGTSSATSAHGMWKPHLRLAVACLLVLVAQAARAGQPAPARPRPNLSRPQPITAFRPSQVGLGRGLTRYLEQKWERKAQRRGELLTDRLRIKAAHLEVPVVVTPSGELMALDRHHHITALRELAEREGIELALPV